MAERAVLFGVAHVVQQLHQLVAHAMHITNDVEAWFVHENSPSKALSTIGATSRQPSVTSSKI
jgi:hypothetical protein